MNKFSIIILLSVIFILSSCSTDNKNKSDEKQDKETKLQSTGDYIHTVLPSIIGYLYETHNGLGNIISHEQKSDNKSKFIAIVYQLPDGSIQAVNFHYEGEFNNTELSLKHPFMVICECDGNCKDCRFKTNEQGQVECGCSDSSIDSPCTLTIDHITDFDFYTNYHEMGLELVKEFIIK